MTPTEAGVLIVAIFALLAIVGFIRFKQKAKLRIKGPGNTSMDLDASNDPQPAIRAHDVKSRKGGFSAQDGTGRGADIEKVDVEKDIEITTKPNDPKA